MHTIQAKADQLRETVGPNLQGVGFDPTVWVQLVTMILGALADCKKKPADVPKLATMPTARERLRLRQIIRHAARRDDLDDEPVGVVSRAIFKLAAETSKADMKTMFAEAAEHGA